MTSREPIVKISQSKSLIAGQVFSNRWTGLGLHRSLSPPERSDKLLAGTAIMIIKM